MLFWIDFSCQGFNNPLYSAKKTLPLSLPPSKHPHPFHPFRPSCKLRASTSMHYVLLENGSMWRKVGGCMFLHCVTPRNYFSFSLWCRLYVSAPIFFLNILPTWIFRMNVC